MLQHTESALVSSLGEIDARAAVTFLGADRIEVLRFRDPDAPLVRYATLGMSASPMTDPTAAVADPLRGPRAELLLTVHAGHPATDRVLRPLAVLAAAPQVEGLVVRPDGCLDLGEPLWPGAPFSAVLVAESGGLVPDLPLPDPCDPVRFFPLLPMTPAETAWQRARGPEALRAAWLAHGTDLRDPDRSAVPLSW
ncbi:suppressor of fused domain protein [Streptomyces carpaticus]|uniref:Suppressor of fused domain protein n=1 Tax=Streptomyces carpaticus TaxID=285558 RepID=A0ABV4ZLN9_9ACTN